MRKLLVLILLVPLVMAQGSYRFVVNDERAQCAAFWPGGDYDYYELESGWRDYESGKVAHDFWNLTHWCGELGYEDIGEITGERRTRLINPWTRQAFFGLAGLAGIVVVLKKWDKL